MIEHLISVLTICNDQKETFEVQKAIRGMVPFTLFRTVHDVRLLYLKIGWGRPDYIIIGRDSIFDEEYFTNEILKFYPINTPVIVVLDEDRKGNVIKSKKNKGKGSVEFHFLGELEHLGTYLQELNFAKFNDFKIASSSS